MSSQEKSNSRLNENYRFRGENSVILVCTLTRIKEFEERFCKILSTELDRLGYKIATSGKQTITG